ncbi:MAG: hypothetical protein WC535_02500 [Candidatus Cloacimonas sp.]|jgi:hypothetical protein|nr:hypothetical protein [Candidatus Cloacimonas sp.]
MKKASLFIVLLIISSGFLLSAKEDKAMNFWQDNYCVQKTVKPPAENANRLQAKVDGKWQEYSLVSFPTAFGQWNKEKRLEYLDIIQEMSEKGPQATRKPPLSGPHNGIVATYGTAREDSKFKLNNAVKGMGFLPKAEKISEITDLLKATINEDLNTKLKILDSLYTNAEDIFAPDRLISLELYSTPEFTTQTFLNQMTNPACVTVFLDIPTFKIKQIARIIHPNDPNLSSYEKNACQYVNLMHSYFHGDYGRDCLAVIYYNIEIYDSSPGKIGGRGTILTPHN